MNKVSGCEVCILSAANKCNSGVALHPTHDKKTTVRGHCNRCNIKPLSGFRITFTVSSTANCTTLWDLLHLKARVGQVVPLPPRTLPLLFGHYVEHPVQGTHRESPNIAGSKDEFSQLGSRNVAWQSPRTFSELYKDLR